MKRTSILICALLLCILSCVNCADLPYSKNKNTNVVELTKETFAREVIGSDKIWIVEFYAPWCGHCKNFAGAYEDAAKNLKDVGGIRIGAINGDDKNNAELLQAFGVQGFPTIKVFPSEAVKQKQGHYWKEPKDYTAGRDAQSLVNFALAQLPKNVQTITDKSIETFLQTKGLLKVLLFTEKKEPTTLFKGLAAEFKQRYIFGQVHDSQKSLLSQYEITKTPSLLVIFPDGRIERKIAGGEKWSFSTLKTWLTELAGAGATGSSSAPPPKTEAEPPKLHQLKSKVDLHQHCLDKKTCFVAILSEENSEPELHAKYLADLKALVDKRGRRVDVVWFDGTHETEFLKHFNLRSGFPTGVVLVPEKQASANFVGGFEESSLVEFLDDVLTGRRKIYKYATPLPNLHFNNTQEDDAGKAQRKAASEKQEKSKII